MRGRIGLMPNQGTSVFFRELFNEILDFFKPGEKKKIMLQHTETLIQPALKKGIKISVVPSPEVFIDIFLLATAENPVLAHKIGRISDDTVARIVRKFLKQGLNISFVDDVYFRQVLIFNIGIDTQVLNYFLFHFAINSRVFYEVKTVSFFPNKHDKRGAQSEY